MTGTRDSSAKPRSDEDAPSTRGILEALLFVGGPPLTLVRASEIIRGLSQEQFVGTLDELNRDYRTQRRPYSVQACGDGFEMRLRPRYRGIVEKLYGTNREARLSNVAVDVLALVAYRQPVSKQDIDSLRGMESAGLLRQLVRRGLIAIVQRVNGDKKDLAYETTPRFLEMFGLLNLEDLPRAQDLQPM